jgi:hypothetical protein
MECIHDGGLLLDVEHDECDNTQKKIWQKKFSKQATKVLLIEMRNMKHRLTF